MKIKEIQEMLAKSQTYQLNPNARYLIVTDGSVTVDECLEIQGWLKGNGADAIVLSLPCKLFEIEKEEPRHFNPQG